MELIANLISIIFISTENQIEMSAPTRLLNFPPRGANWMGGRRQLTDSAVKGTASWSEIRTIWLIRWMFCQPPLSESMASSHFVHAIENYSANECVWMCYKLIRRTKYRLRSLPISLDLWLSMLCAPHTGTDITACVEIGGVQFCARLVSILKWLPAWITSYIRCCSSVYLVWPLADDWLNWVS